MTKGYQHNLDLCYKVLQYLWQSFHLTLTFNCTEGINFYVMVDSSYASHSDRKSHYGFSVYMNYNSGSCIFVSKKSTLLASSSTEADEASKLILWLRQFRLELGFPPTSPTFLHEDNKSAIE